MEMTRQELRADPGDLRRFTREVLERLGMPPEDAETEADVLLWANLRGVDSHGVQLIPWYVLNVDEGVYNTTPNFRVESETPATVLIEGDQAFGPIVTVFAMNRVIEKAAEVGVCWGIIRNTAHQGAMGYYALMPTQRDMAGIASVCSPPNMAPFGARAKGVHNSPIAIAVPAKDRDPILLDMATSIVAKGKLSLAEDRGESVPVEWSLDPQGNPTTVPSFGSIMLPIAGPKGSGLALMFETLSSVMVGNPLLEVNISGRRPTPRGLQNSFLVAINIAAFTDVERYKENIDLLIDAQKSLPRAEGVEEIFVPGEPEYRIEQERTRSGIPLPAGTVDRLRAVAERLGVRMPEGTN
jgi:LDH2 family malate/lactate/ureidoglycolate dehydrogenase